MIIVHNRLIREDPNSDSFRDSVIASTKETSILLLEILF